mmetsp:Transcript_12076/g.50808  ORF Transcript_12076/g.50808 Transcript_12076/m.50808 type:complete len:216 (-) Transcript_12076:53-700(-)
MAASARIWPGPIWGSPLMSTSPPMGTILSTFPPHLNASPYVPSPILRTPAAVNLEMTSSIGRTSLSLCPHSRSSAAKGDISSSSCLISTLTSPSTGSALTNSGNCDLTTGSVLMATAAMAWVTASTSCSVLTLTGALTAVLGVGAATVSSSSESRRQIASGSGSGSGPGSGAAGSCELTTLTGSSASGSRSASSRCSGLGDDTPSLLGVVSFLSL